MTLTLAAVISHMNMGGTQRQLDLLLRGLDRDRWNPCLICLGPETPLLAALRSDGIDVRRVPKRGPADPTLLPRLTREIRSLRPAIVHTFLRTANLWGRAAAIASGAPALVASERSVAYRTGSLVLAANRLLGRRTDLVTVNSAAGAPYAAWLHGHPPARIEIVPNGVRLPALAARDREGARLRIRAAGGWRPDDRVVALIGNLLPEKRIGEAIEIAARLRGGSSNLRWIVFGEGSERESLRAALSRHRLEDVFLLAGHRDDLHEILPGADLLLQTSAREGLPNAVLEGMAAGLPVVATDAGGTREAVEDRRTGIVVPVGDRAAMERAIRELLDPAGPAAHYGRAGRERAEGCFSIEAMVRRSERLYEDRCLEEGRVRRVAVVLSRHSARATFIVREMRALRAVGLDLVGFSLLPPEGIDGICSALAGREDGVDYIPFLPGPLDAAAAAGIALRHPIRTLSAAGTIVGGQIRTPRVMLRGVAVFPKILLLAAGARRWRVGSIHAHWATVSATAGMAAARICGLPFSFSGHAWDLVFDTALLGEKLRAARFAAVCNRFNGELLRGRYPESAAKVHLAYHGLDLERFVWQPPPGRSGPLRILAIGRLVEKKGFDALIRACGILRTRGIAVECHIVGDGGPEASRLEGLASAVAPGAVRFDGFVSEEGIVPLMRAHDLLAAPSVVQADGAMDGIPNVVLEAMACGLPVVTTAVAGLPEVAVEGVTALVVPERDPEALARAFERLHREPDLGASLSRRARIVIEREFDLRVTARRLADLLTGEKAEGAEASSSGLRLDRTA